MNLAVSLVVAATTVAVGSTPALAFGPSVACGSRSEAPVFARWGDAGSYFRVPNGGFENGAAEWLLSGGAAVATGSETFKVGGASDAFSLRIRAGGAAESRTICISRGEDTFRFFARNPGVAGAILHVDATVRNLANGAVATVSNDVRSGDMGPGWSPSLRFQVSDVFGGNGTEELTFTFTTRGTTATWYLDDLYVDPFKSY